MENTASVELAPVVIRSANGIAFGLLTVLVAWTVPCGGQEAFNAQRNLEELRHSHSLSDFLLGSAVSPHIIGQATAVSAGSLAVTNGASFLPKISPGGWITIQGTNLANVTRVWEAKDFTGDTLPIVLSGTSVRIGSKDAAIYYISPSQVNALVPADSPAGPSTLTVTSPLGPVTPLAINVDLYAPGLFMFGPENSRYVAATFPDGTFVGKTGLFGASPPTRPVKAGERVSLYATGLGATNPAVPPGKNFGDPRPMYGLDFFHATIGGQLATVEFVGAISPGLYQINLVAPVLQSGDYPVSITYGDDPRSQPGAMITIKGDPGFSQLVATPAAVAMQAFTTSTTPSSQLLQLSSTGEDFDFSLTSSVPWLTLDKQSGHTPAAIHLLADGRTLTPGAYTARITVLAPGTASPSTTIQVNVTASNTPQISVSRTSLSYQLLSGYESLSIPVNVLSDAGAVDFTVSKIGDTWLSVPASGRTPGVVTVNLSSESRAAGGLSGTVRITPAGGGTPRDIAVSLTVLPTAADGPAQIIALDEDDMLWGRKGSWGFWGQNLDGATGVTISPPQGITADTVKSGSSARVTLNLAIDGTAAEGPHTITVTTAKGVSNAFPFNIRQGKPQIHDLTPAVVNPGRYYATAGLVGSPGAALQFHMAGADLTGVTSMRIDPGDNIFALPALGSPGIIQGVIAVGNDAQPGMRTLTAITPAGPSNSLPIEVRAPSPNAPVISNLTLSSTFISGSGFSHYVNYSGKFDFKDADGDITSAGQILLIMDIGTGSEYVTLVVDNGSYLEQKGKTSGTISFQFQKSFGLLYQQFTGTLPIAVEIMDAAGNLSNYIGATVSTWQIPVL